MIALLISEFSLTIIKEKQMTLIRWAHRPSLINDIDSIYNLFNSNIANRYDYSGWSPNFETLNMDNTYIVRAELPGLTKKDVNIEISDNYVTISGEKKNQFADDDMLSGNSCFHYGTFKKGFSLPDDAIESKIEARMKDGILTLDIPRIKPVKPKTKTISIK